MPHIDQHTAPRRAVLYFRKGGEHRAIREPALRAYAKEHGFVVVQVYADDEESGQCQALARLRGDITSTMRAFEAVLHFDVTAWGRFMAADNIDEYLCQQHGVEVIYLHPPCRP